MSKLILDASTINKLKVIDKKCEVVWSSAIFISTTALISIPHGSFLHQHPGLCCLSSSWSSVHPQNILLPVYAIPSPASLTISSPSPHPLHLFSTAWGRASWEGAFSHNHLCCHSFVVTDTYYVQLCTHQSPSSPVICLLFFIWI